MSAVPFDTLKSAQQLEAGGFSPEQSRTAAAALAEAMSGADLVTKEHLNNRLNDMEQRFTIRVGGMFIVAVGVILTALRYFLAHP